MLCADAQPNYVDVKLLRPGGQHKAKDARDGTLTIEQFFFIFLPEIFQSYKDSKAVSLAKVSFCPLESWVHS